ncbi:MarR family winged helix-turn-helix transcriptional regulator [Acinetobacter baylyi]|uniref:MarR family winged helix-turn-helix transcriptional regulator n=1 Tax=Acinetobacter baylyi TaxID=202950 RepID=UPI000EA01EB5|nr:MarR family transcriptional regulator [Acinetobacter baylyi]
MDQSPLLGHYLDHLHALVASVIFPHMGKALNGEFSFSQLNTLFLLYTERSCSIAKIADNAAISHNAASRMVDRLVQGQYVVRIEDKFDRRLKNVSLTVAGFNKLKELQIITADVYSQIFLTVPLELKQQLEATLKQIEPFLPPMTHFTETPDLQEDEK